MASAGRVCYLTIVICYFLPKNTRILEFRYYWIEEVWANYLSNAIKYGGNPSQIEIGVDFENSKEMVRFWVRDNGKGISPANQKKVSKPFELLEQIKTEGNGLGPSIVKRIIKKLEGQVGVESEPGKGSLFYFTLPVKKGS